MNRDVINISLRWVPEEACYVARASELELRARGRTKRKALTMLAIGIDNWLDEHGEVMQYEVFTRKG